MSKLRNMFSTRKCMQIAPETEMMHELTPEELKAPQACFLEIIKDIDRVCQEHGLCYGRRRYGLGFRAPQGALSPGTTMWISSCPVRI